MRSSVSGAAQISIAASSMRLPWRSSASVTGWRICCLVCAKACGDSAARACAAATARSSSAVRLGDLVDQAAGQRRVGRKGRAAVACRRQDSAAAWSNRMISNASAGNGTPTSSSVTPMRPPSLRRDPLVGARMQHAAAGDGVAVDRCDHRLGKEEHRVVEPVQRRQEAPHVRRAALAQPNQIDAGGKHPALAGEHHGPGGRIARAVELRGDRLAELDVERIGLAVHHGHDGDAAALATVRSCRAPRHGCAGYRGFRRVGERPCAKAARHGSRRW